MHVCSEFWMLFAAGLITLHPAFAQRDQVETFPGEEMSMAEWLRMKETHRAAYVAVYAEKKPPLRYTSTKERRQQERRSDTYSG